MRAHGATSGAASSQTNLFVLYTMMSSRLVIEKACIDSWGFHTVRGGIVRGDNRFRRRLIGFVDIRKAFYSDDGVIHSPGAGGFMNPSQSAISKWGWSFHTVWGGIDPEGHRFRPSFVVVVNLCKDF